MIKSIHLENFGAFKDLKVSFSPGLNVILGGNGTGKTILLKAVYAIAHSCNALRSQQNEEKDSGEIFSSKLRRLFLPNDDSFKAFRFKDSEGPIKVSVKTWRGHAVTAVCQAPYDAFSLECDSNGQDDFGLPVFLPAKDCFSLLKAFKGKRIPRELKEAFDDTYLDIAKLTMAEHEESDPTPAKIDSEIPVVKNLAEMIGGSFAWDNSEIVYQNQICANDASSRQKAKKGLRGAKSCAISAAPGESFKIHGSFAADGHKKISDLIDVAEKFLSNPKKGGILLWDEPESNLNPTYMESVVSALNEIAKAGNQVILVSHDTVIVEWLRIVGEYGEKDSLYMHNLFRAKNSRIMVKSTRDYSDIMDNLIHEGLLDMAEGRIDRDRSDANAAR